MATSAVQVITESLKGSTLSRAMASGTAPPEWNGPPPRGQREWERHVRHVAESTSAGWAERLGPAIAASGAAGERLHRCIARGGVVVTGGQQPGLFGGPIYTWSKAVSTLALADAIEAATGVATVPIFWAATDDGDYAESSWTMISLPTGVEMLRLRPSDQEGIPMSATPLGDVSRELAALHEAAGSVTYGAALEAVERAYSAGQTVGGAYVALLRALLEPLGIVVLDAAHPALRRAASPILRHALSAATDVDNALRARNEQIRQAGFEPQVSHVRGRSLVFSLVAGVRRRVPLADAAAKGISAGDDELGANVLLRPVIERALLPTVAYVAGPAELAYFAQSRAVAEALGVAPPLAVPRWSATILESHVARVLTRLGVAREELLDPHAPETRLAREALPAGVSAALLALRADVDRAIDGMREGDPSSPPLLPDIVLSGARRQIEHRVDRLVRRYVAAIKRRHDSASRDLAMARGALYPAGRLQERALNFLPLLARYGPDLLEEMRRQASAHAAALIGEFALADAGVGQSRQPDIPDAPRVAP